jgi:hypothetical protein
MQREREVLGKASSWEYPWCNRLFDARPDARRTETSLRCGNCKLEDGI